MTLSHDPAPERPTRPPSFESTRRPRELPEDLKAVGILLQQVLDEAAADRSATLREREELRRALIDVANQVAALTQSVATLSQLMGTLDARVWQVLTELAGDRQSQLAIVQAAWSGPPRTPSLSPTRIAARQLGPWALVLAATVSLFLGIGIAAGIAGALGVRVEVPGLSVHE